MQCTYDASTSVDYQSFANSRARESRQETYGLSRSTAKPATCYMAHDQPVVVPFECEISSRFPKALALLEQEHESRGFMSMRLLMDIHLGELKIEISFSLS